MSDMGALSEGERDGSPSAPADQGGELVDADSEGLAGAEGCAPIGGLLRGGVEDAGRHGGQCAFDCPAITDFHLIGFAVLGQGHIARTPGVGGQ